MLNWGRFASKESSLSSSSNTAKAVRERVEKLISYDEKNEKKVPMIDPLVVRYGEELHVFGYEGFIQNFGSCVSVIAYPGQGKSLLCTTLYNLMRGTDEEYFLTSTSPLSFTKGIWRLSDEHKRQHLGSDDIDFLDVEGLQRENAVYYMLIIAIVLSRAVVLLSRERVNTEALQLLSTAFKIIRKLRIPLHKPTLFIETKTDKDGTLLNGGEPTTKEALIEFLRKDIPIIGEFKVEFFSLTTLFDPTTLLQVEALQVKEHEELRRRLYNDSFELYRNDVRALLDKLMLVQDPVPSETRMEYVMKTLTWLNNKNPDLVLEQTLDFYEKDAIRFLESAVCQERESLIAAHRNKPLKGAKTLEEFFDPPQQSLQERFTRYTQEESPFLGDLPDGRSIAPFRARAAQVFEKSIYAKSILQAKDPATGMVIGIMSYVQPDFEAKKKSSDSVLQSVFLLLQDSLEKYLVEWDDFFNARIPVVAPHSTTLEIKRKFANVEGIDSIVMDRWKAVCIDLENRRQTLKAESKWIKKVRAEVRIIRGADEHGNQCTKCGKTHNDLVSHKECPNHANVPTVLWYWIKDSSTYAICSGCDEIVRISGGVTCWTCDAPLRAKVVPPDW